MPPKNVCDLALTCCKRAFEILAPGKSCNADLEFGKPPAPDLCHAALQGFKKLFEEEKQPLPKECDVVH